ncbi:pirin family protein [Snuella lapsa]|uniref:Pirin family protein n=1 Tax=Snuella lapsa TaxID=870481 RepID=A0ABP6X150_9FLAO
MKTIVHKANTRGYANHGWLQSYHSFSFANYYNPDRVHFGALRVLNDDTVSAGMGFGTHPHSNMEIVSIPLEGDLEHKDSMGNTSIIREGEIQVMSAGTGIYHSEYNKNKDVPVKFLQIWVVPNEQDVAPRYDQITIEALKKDNLFYGILSPENEYAGVWIHQDAWFFMGEFNEETEIDYVLKREGNGVYFFVLDGEAEIAGNKLEERDGLGVWETPSVAVKAKKGARVLAIEVPMLR